MTAAKAVKTSVTNNSLSQDYNNLDDQLHTSNNVFLENVSTRASELRLREEIIKLEIVPASETIQAAKTEYHAQIVEKPHVLKRRHVIQEKTNTDNYNIILITFNSMSSANFQRTMPKVYEFLKKDHQSVIFPGFSVLGEGAQGMYAVMAGMRSAVSRNDDRRQEKPRWLLRMFQDSGYVTMATQDQLAFGEMRMMLKRFGASSVDHNLDALWEEVHRNGYAGESTFCLGSQFPFNISLSYLKSFLESYRNHPKFAIMMNSALTSWNMNTASYAEKPLLHFLKKRKLLRNTVVVILGKHGWKGNGFRETSQGKLEERLPFLSMTLPTGFLKRYPDKFQQMVSNSRLLVSPLDVHATISDLLSLSESGINTTQNTTQGQSMFRKLDTNYRNCTSLGIPEHWCPCVWLHEVNVSESNLKKITNVVMENLHYILKDAPSGMCRKLYFKNVVSVKVLRILNKVLRYRTSEGTRDCPYCKPVFWKSLGETKDAIYQVDIRVEPGERVYRTMVNLIENDLYIGVRPRLISGRRPSGGGCMKMNNDDFIADYCECTEEIF